MKKSISILAAMMLLNIWSVNAQTEATAICGDTVTITATADRGYEFDYWDDDPTNKNAVRNVVIDADSAAIEYKAVFKLTTYTINVAAKDPTQGSVMEETVYGNLDSTVVVTAVENNECYAFSHWEDEMGVTLSEDNPYSYTIAGNATIYAVFKEKEFTVKVSSPVTGGTVSIVRKTRE